MSTMYLPAADHGGVGSDAPGSVDRPARWLRLCLTLIAAAVLTAVAAPSAQAAVGYERTGAFAEVPNDGGVTQTHNGRIAVRASTGDIYVTDTDDDRIAVYRPNTTDADLLTTFGAGTLTDPYGIAIDQATGDVYVSDEANTRVTKFQSDGAATPTFTEDAAFTSPGAASALAFDAAADQLVYIDPTDQKIKRATTAGAAAGTPLDGSTSGTAFTGLQDLAVTSTGEIVVVDSTGDITDFDGVSRVERFDPDGSHNGTLDPVETAATVAIIPEGDQIVVTGRQNSLYIGGANVSLTVFANDGTRGPTVESGEAYSIATGVAAADGPGARVYLASDASPKYGSAYGDAGVQAFEPYTLPEVSVGTVDGISATGATFRGTVDPNGGPQTTNVYFEYSIDSGNSWTPTPEQDPGTGTDPVDVTAAVTGLASGGRYQVRLVASKGGSPTASSTVEFSTDAAVPAVTGQTASDVEARSARVGANVTPSGEPTTYHVEFGPTATYGQRLPQAAESRVGTGSAPIRVGRSIPGLQPATTYHVRFVATNALGTTYGPDVTFTTLTERVGQPGGGRHYELVSPSDKVGQAVRVTALSPDGRAVGFANTGSGNGLPGTEAAPIGGFTSYLGLRENSAWRFVPMNPSQTAAFHNLYQDASPQLDRQLFTGEVDPAAGQSALFLARPGQQPRRVSPVLTNLDGVNDYTWAPQYVGSSQDLTHSVLRLLLPGPSQGGRLLPEDPGTSFYEGGGAYQLYETIDSDPPLLRRVDVATDGQIIGRCGSILGGDGHASRAVSRDGRRIFFTSVTELTDDGCFGGRTLFARIDGRQTERLSTSECRRTADPTATPPVEACSPATSGVQYESASADGDRVFFTTSDQLVDGDTDTTRDLYMYDFGAPAGARLTQLSAGDSTDATPGAGADVQGFLRASEDGSRAYFVASGVLTTTPNRDNAAAVEGSNNLYVATAAGDITFVATLDRDNPQVWAGSDSSGFRPAQLADSAGRYLVFASETPLTGDDTDAATDVYRYDAQSGVLRRISVGRNGFGDDGNSDTGPASVSGPDAPQNSYASVTEVSRQVSGDGSRIAFTTTQALEPDDVNGRLDVYEWNDGQVQLVSDGQDSGGVESGTLMSEDGSTIAFSTSRRLLPDRDTDTASDVYVARTGGDVDPLPTPAAAPCSGDACQGPSTPPPPLPVAGSVSFDGGAPLGPGRGRVSVAVSRLKAVVGSTASLRVKVPAAGRISVSGTSVRQNARSVSKAGTYIVRAALGATARKRLAKRKTVKIKARVSYRATDGRTAATSVSVTFKAAKAKKPTTTKKGGR